MFIYRQFKDEDGRSWKKSTLPLVCRKSLAIGKALGLREQQKLFSRAEFRRKGVKAKTRILRSDYSVLNSKEWRNQNAWESFPGGKKLRGLLEAGKPDVRKRWSAWKTSEKVPLRNL